MRSISAPGPQAWLRTAGPDTIDVAWTEPGRAMITRAAPAAGSVGRVHTLAVAGVDPAGAVIALADRSLGNDPVVVTVPDSAVLVVPDATDATWGSAAIAGSQSSAVGLIACSPDHPTAGAAGAAWTRSVPACSA